LDSNPIKYRGKKFIYYREKIIIKLVLFI